jgi:ubiquinone/menaquinone biosynthesis C-methylase UbiE
VFDCLLSCYTLDLLPEADISTVLLEFQRVLRGGGLILVVMGHQTPLTQQIWMMLFRHIPLLVGYCRPINAATRLRTGGWNIESREQVTQTGFRSEVLVARPHNQSGLGHAHQKAGR